MSPSLNSSAITSLSSKLSSLTFAAASTAASTGTLALAAMPCFAGFAGFAAFAAFAGFCAAAGFSQVLLSSENPAIGFAPRALPDCFRATLTVAAGVSSACVPAALAALCPLCKCTTLLPKLDVVCVLVCAQDKAT